MQVEVDSSGELVILEIGNFALSMHFACAMKVAYLLLTHGRLARRVAIGRNAALLPTIRAMGVLSNATPEKIKVSRWARKLPELYDASEIYVCQIGSQVELKLRNTVAGLPYEAALAISQLLRVHGRKCAASINEKASWNQLANG